MVSRRQQHALNRWRLAIALSTGTLGMLIAGAVRLHAQELPDTTAAPNAGMSPLARPDVPPPPPLLTEYEVERGLGDRLQGMRQRHQADLRLRFAEPPRDYTVVEPLSDGPEPRRPDAPGGEFGRLQAGGVR